jgi:hypothetical protein
MTDRSSGFRAQNWGARQTLGGSVSIAFRAGQLPPSINFEVNPVLRSSAAPEPEASRKTGWQGVGGWSTG